MLPPVQAIKNSVQSFPPAGSFAPGTFFFEYNRSWILSPVGTKERDRELRLFDRHPFSPLWQGARSGITKKIASMEYQINGPRVKAQYFQDLLGYAHFGHGWEYMIQLALTDFLTQSYGAIFEIVGPGEPNEPLLGEVTAINHLDAMRCYFTGNPIYPVMYYSLWTGQLHRMHASRVYVMVDDPISDERFFGLGTSALERVIAIAQREIRMAQYIDAMLDDKPQPGILSITNASDAQWQALVNKYMQEQSNDERPVFGKTIVVTGLDPNAEVKVQVIPFSQTPEKFDFVKYTDLDVSAMAEGLGIDRQELWELAGRGLGSGSQSSILAIKSRGKLYGNIISKIQRFINWGLLPDDCEFVFKEQDQMQDQVQSTIDLTYAQIATTLQQAGFSQAAIARLLVEKSASYKDALTNDMGQVSLSGSDPQSPAQVSQDVQLDSNTPLPDVGKPQPVAAPAMAGTRPPSLLPGNKAFSSTAADFRTRFEDILSRAIAGRLRQGQAENLMLSLIQSAGAKAFADGLAEGGVTDELSDDDSEQIQTMTVDAIDYLDGLLTEAYAGRISESQAPIRADMWANKTLTDFFNAGRVSADRDQMYMWVLGKTEEHCEDCLRLNGQVHRFGQWYSKGWLPQSDRLTCKGFNCGCTLKVTKEKARGRF